MVIILLLLFRVFVSESRAVPAILFEDTRSIGVRSLKFTFGRIIIYIRTGHLLPGGSTYLKRQGLSFLGILSMTVLYGTVPNH